MSTIHIIYVPGLGDPNKWEKSLVSWWKVFGVEVTYSPIIWDDGQPFNPKFNKLLSLIDDLHSKKKQVALVGTSAGASAVLNAYAMRPAQISGLVTICGKIQNLHKIGGYYFQRSPAFKKSVQLLPASLKSLSSKQLKNIMTIKPLGDSIVPPDDALIVGARHKTIPTFGHVFSIAYSLTIGARTIIKFLKSTA